MIDFFSGVGLWAQYSEGGHAPDEWEIVASGYRIEQTGASTSGFFGIVFIFPRAGLWAPRCPGVRGNEKTADLWTGYGSVLDRQWLRQL